MVNLEKHAAREAIVSLMFEALYPTEMSFNIYYTNYYILLSLPDYEYLVLSIIVTGSLFRRGLVS